MCESNAYVLTPNGEKMVMENIANMKVDSGKIFLTGLLGDEKTINGIIQEIKLLEHKILITEKA
ncbi:MULTISPECIES: CooT family nickel-binding protein [unclassified Dehalobacter]|jgi:Predicted RNA-binding protein.|uniref:CooT family nickel-binding protein n=1 Tax=unclassified Dehalobacter TaxID=2635733 RepID=UPI0005547DAD|nr:MULTISPECIES: CooT family nickel-binding protein [unclassified Dehalobacter]